MAGLPLHRGKVVCFRANVAMSLGTVLCMYKAVACIPVLRAFLTSPRILYPPQLNPRALEAFDGPYDLWEEAAKESLEFLLDADNHPMLLLDRFVSVLFSHFNRQSPDDTSRPLRV